MTLTIAGLLFGAVFGLCFEVVILIPIILLVVAAIAAAGLTFGMSAGSTVLVMVVAATALQLGYLGGSVVRFAAEKFNSDMRTSRAVHEDSNRARAPQSASRSLRSPLRRPA
jgi:hypothetical protein